MVGREVTDVITPLNKKVTDVGVIDVGPTLPTGGQGEVLLSTTILGPSERSDSLFKASSNTELLSVLV